jgi:4-hydroxybenzoate polyprenyltransferase
VLRQYLLLVRLPNIFTAPSNVLTGYVAAVVPAANADALQLSLLMLSSTLLYIAGIVFNDYFDIGLDKRERPYRPLPSGSISTKIALLIAIISLISANILAFTASMSSLAVCIFVSVMVIGYDYRLKNTFFGPIAMGVIRSLNIILGASPALFVILIPYNHTNANSYHMILTRIIFVSLTLFVYVLAISLLSRKEVVAGEEREGKQSDTQTRQIIIISFLLVLAIVLSTSFAVFLGLFKMNLFVSLVLFSAIMVITFKQTNYHNSLTIQNAIRYMVISIIVLDSIFITGFTGSYYGLLTLILALPSIFLARKFYVT